jgi:hypothetical protein
MPSAAFFFGQSTLNLSGTINVLLFLTIRPKLLLFVPSDDSADTESETQMSHLNMGAVPNSVQRQCTPEATVLGLDNSEGRPWNLTFEGSASSHVGSNRGCDDI